MGASEAGQDVLDRVSLVESPRDSYGSCMLTSFVERARIAGAACFRPLTSTEAEVPVRLYAFALPSRGDRHK